MFQVDNRIGSDDLGRPLVTSIGSHLTLEDFIAKHEQVLSYTVSTFNRIRIVAFLFGIDYSLRMNIFVSYAQSLDNNVSTSAIGMVIYFTYFVSGLFSLINGFVADSWRFDYLFLFATLLDVITFWFEATANSFKMLAIAYIIGGQTIQTIVYGYSSKFLPVINCKVFQSDWMQLYAIGQLIGPVLGGFVAGFTTYRAVFYTSAITSVVLFVFGVLTVGGSHKKMLQEQTSLVPYYRHFRNFQAPKKSNNNNNNNNNNNDNNENNDGTNGNENDASASGQDNGPPRQERSESTTVDKIISKENEFPICKSLIVSELDDVQIRSANARQISKHVNATKVNKIHLFITMLIIIDMGLLISGDTALITWYVAYIRDEFHGSVLFATGNMSVYIATTTMAIFGIKKLLQKRLNKRKEKMILLILFIIAQAIRGTIQLYLVPQTDNIVKHLNSLINMSYFIDNHNHCKYFFWFYTVLLGSGFGIVLMCMMLVFIEVMPKNIAGKIAGIKLCLEYGLKGVAALIVGTFWSKSHQWLWYIIGFETGISSFLYFFVLFLMYACNCR